jgi:hypothetical protein
VLGRPAQLKAVLDAVGTVDQRTFEEALPDHAD